jgi:hypothetical protein
MRVDASLFERADLGEIKDEVFRPFENEVIGRGSEDFISQVISDRFSLEKPHMKSGHRSFRRYTPQFSLFVSLRPETISRRGSRQRSRCFEERDR